MKDTPYEKWSRASFKIAYEEAEALRKKAVDELQEERAIRKGLDETLKTSRENFNDLKQRLHAAETSNQFMRGYLARVQEDDVVREDLLTVGEPDGEQHMVPKRKPTTFERPSDFTEQTEDRGLYGGYASRERRKPKHWITY